MHTSPSLQYDIDKRWAELVYDAQWFSPAVKSLNAFIDDTQQYVSGEIRMLLHGDAAVILWCVHQCIPFRWHYPDQVRSKRALPLSC